MSNNEEETIERNNDEQKRATEMYQSHRDELYRRELSNTQAYDKAILSLSSAGLAISLTFIKFIVPLEKADHLWMIKTLWVLFLLSIISTVISFLIGNKAISRQREDAEQYYIHGNANAQNKFNIFSCINSILNYISGILFVVALIFVISFVILNLN